MRSRWRSSSEVDRRHEAEAQEERKHNNEDRRLQEVDRRREAEAQEEEWTRDNVVGGLSGASYLRSYQAFTLTERPSGGNSK